MQNINFGNKPVYSQSYPAYPNCFDLLAIHGVVAEDPMAYMTGTPSPYLQNYVAQKGGVPSLPGQLVPDNLPPLPQPAPMPNGDFYQSGMPPQNGIPQTSDLNPNTFSKHKTWDKIKKVAAAGLVTGLLVLAVVKGKGLVSKVSKFFKKAPTAQTAQNARQAVQNAGQAVQNAGQAVQTAVQTTAQTAGNAVNNAQNASTSKWKSALKYAGVGLAGVLATLGLSSIFSKKPQGATAQDLPDLNDVAVHAAQPIGEEAVSEEPAVEQNIQPDLPPVSVPIASQPMAQAPEQPVMNPTVPSMPMGQPMQMGQPMPLPQPQIQMISPMPAPVQPQAQQIMPMQQPQIPQVSVTTA